MIGTMDRGARRRAARMRPGEGLAIGENVLRKPNHWHCDTAAYSHEEDGHLMGAIHIHNLVTNDLTLTEAYVLRTVKPLAGPKRDKVVIEQANMCSDPAHYEAGEPDLLEEEELQN